MRKVDCTASVLDLGEAGELRALSTVMVLKTCENLSPNSSLSDCMAFRTESASLPGIRMAISISVPVLNLRKIQRALLRMLAYLLEILAQNKNWALVQWTLCKHRKGLSDDGRRKNLVRHYAGAWRVVGSETEYTEL